jgi:hypothetical protein
MINRNAIQAQNHSQAHRETRALRRLEGFVHIMDNAVRIPGTKYRVGVDALIGLFPGIGDTLTTIASFYLVAEAVYLDVKFAVILRMLYNIFLDWLLGCIPLLGDIFDATWKANVKNLELLKRSLELGQREY